VIEPQLAIRFLSVLHALLDIVNWQYLAQFADLVCDVVLLGANDWQIAGSGFRFLTRIRWSAPPLAIKKSCVDWIVRMYRAITHYDSRVESPLDNNQLPTLISCVETDIVALDMIDVKSEMLPLLYCYQYFVVFTQRATAVAAELTRELLMLFPADVIPGSKALFAPESPEFRAYCPSVASILKTESSAPIAALCCDFLLDVPVEFREGTFEVVNFMVSNSRVCAASSLFAFYRYLIALKPDEGRG
jgi:hypothetical protein